MRKVIYYSEEDRAWIGQCPELLRSGVCADTFEEAEKKLNDAIEGVTAAL
jgi:predicted RNase H-like HicB family nuclease